MSNNTCCNLPLWVLVIIWFK